MRPSQLQIKTLALERMTKEKGVYEQEILDHMAEIKDMKAKLADDKDDEELKYTLKNRVDILEETRRMVPHMQGKLREQVKDLKSYMRRKQPENDSDARKAIKEAEKAIGTHLYA